MRLQASAATLLALVAAPSAWGQNINIGGRDQFPQFRVLSGLPGGGFGVLPSGRPGIDGAAALTTPIGYTLGSHVALGLFNTTGNLDPLLFDSGGRNAHEETSNGTLQAMIGSSFAGFHGSAGFEILSTRLDSVLNFQISPPLKGRLGVAVGVQDLDGGGGSAGTGYPSDTDSSRSVYGVGTYDFGRGTYVSLGAGQRRFHGVFGNASAAIVPGRLRGIVEYDSFNFNGGVIYNPGRFKALGGLASRVESNLFLGLVQFRYSTIGLTFTF